MTIYSYEIAERPNELGGGWRLKLLQDGMEVGGAVQPGGSEEENVDAYNDLIAEAQDWLESRPQAELPQTITDRQFRNLCAEWANSRIHTEEPWMEAQAWSAVLCARYAHSSAVQDVLAERQRQVDVKDWTPEHDDEHPNGEIAAFAALYAMPPAARDWPAAETGYGDTFGAALCPVDWFPKFGDRRRELVKAGALIVAEIERLDRAAIKHYFGEKAE